jgi:trimethylamine--corrinoid protein Co-methyltransferase
MLGGAHILNESVGVLDNILICSYEKTIIDGELIRRIKRIWKGIEGPDKNMSVDLIQEIGHSGETYLTHSVTLEHCRERWRPTISYWGTYENWIDSGGEDIVTKANRKYKEVLENAPESLIDSEVDKELKAYIKKHVTS